ncbi:MAG: serine/threonine protein kinase [Ruminococcaceae bacterium]|nr:serine/threonine protein kinase [Oscillospiraceae bacterium]
MEYGFNSICPFCFAQKGYSQVCSRCGYEEKVSPLTNHLRPRTMLLNRYMIGALIGVGGFGIVYKAYDMKLNRVVAVKEMFPTSLVNRIAGQQEVIITSQRNVPQFRYMLERFKLEAKSLSRLVNNPNVASVYDCVEANNTAYIIMEYLEGQTLDNRLARQGRIDQIEALRIITAALDGLAAAHSCGIIHRDIKPGNIFLCRDGSVKIIDFGAARFEGFAEDPRMICSKVFTDGFAPPEQYREDGEQGPFTDIYAAGATLYAMLTAHIPPPSPDIRDGSVVLHAPSRWQQGISPALDSVILRAMSLDPRIRFADAMRFKEALLSGDTVRTEPEELSARRRRRVIAAVAVLFTLCAAALGGWFYLRQMQDSDSAQNMIVSDQTINVYVCVEEDEIQEQQELYGTLADGFSSYAAEVTPHKLDVSVVCVTEKTIEDTIIESGESAALICSKRTFEQECTSDWLQALTEDSYKFAPADPNGFVTTFDRDVLYVNLKLLEQAGLDVSQLDSLESITAAGHIYADKDLIGDYECVEVKWGALEDFCAGKTLFCAARASDFRQVFESLPGYCHAMSLPGDSEGTEYTDVWRINGAAEENVQHTAELFLAYLVSDEAQDILCLQNDSGLPANSAIYDLYVTYHPELAEVLEAE